MSNKPNGTLYVGATSNLLKRIYEHKTGVVESFSKKYSINKLVYYEEASGIHGAIEREKQIKNWKRDWKVQLIEKENPTWSDLSVDF